MRKTLADFPDVAAQWHPTENGDRTPDQVVAGPHKKVWWKCDKGPDHDWEATLSSRTSGTGCPYCAGQRVSVTNSLAKLFPDIASQWHPTRNADLTPAQVVAGSNKKYWWKCDKESDHEWDATMASRTKRGTGCPYCAGQRVSVTNSLAKLFPDIAGGIWDGTFGDASRASVAFGGLGGFYSGYVIGCNGNCGGGEG